MVEVDGVGWIYNRLMERYYPVVIVMERDYDIIAYTMIEGRYSCIP